MQPCFFFFFRNQRQNMTFCCNLHSGDTFERRKKYFWLMKMSSWQMIVELVSISFYILYEYNFSELIDYLRLWNYYLPLKRLADFCVCSLTLTYFCIYSLELSNQAGLTLLLQCELLSFGNHFKPFWLSSTRLYVLCVCVWEGCLSLLIYIVSHKPHHPRHVSVYLRVDRHSFET